MKRQNKVQEFELENLAKKFKLKRKDIKDEYYIDNRRKNLQEKPQITTPPTKLQEANNKLSKIRSNLKKESAEEVEIEEKSPPTNHDNKFSKIRSNLKKNSIEKFEIGEKSEENKEIFTQNSKIRVNKLNKDDYILKNDQKSIIEQLKSEINEAKSQKEKNKTKYDQILQEASHYLKEDLKKMQTTDICFILDVTKSMQKYINISINSIMKIIKNVKNIFKNSDIYLSLVGYRDLDYNEQDRFVIINFTSNYSEIKEKLSNIELKGGFDCCEDINGALQKMLQLDWKSENKIVFHIFDSPCHNAKYNGINYLKIMYKDNYANGAPTDKPFETIFEDFLRKKIQYYMIYTNSSVELMIENFRKIYFNLKCQYNIENMFIAQKVEEDVDNFINERAQTIISNVSKSVFDKITFQCPKPSKKDFFLGSYDQKNYNERNFNNMKVFHNIELFSGEIPAKSELFENLNNYNFNVNIFFFSLLLIIIVRVNKSQQIRIYSDAICIRIFSHSSFSKFKF